MNNKKSNIPNYRPDYNISCIFKKLKLLNITPSSYREVYDEDSDDYNHDYYNDYDYDADDSEFKNNHDIGPTLTFTCPGFNHPKEWW